MAESAVVKETCVQCACFFLAFFEAGEWQRRERSPWQNFKKAKVTPENVRALAAYTERRITRCADLMAFLQSIHDDWTITAKKDGVWMETETMIYEDILPKLRAAGFTDDDYQLYSEYTRKWGMI